MTELEQQLQARLDKAIEVFKEKEEQIAKLKAQVVELSNQLSWQDEDMDNLKNENDDLKKKLEYCVPIVKKYNEEKTKENTKIIEEVTAKTKRKEYVVPVTKEVDALPSNFRLQDFGNTFSM